MDHPFLEILTGEKRKAKRIDLPKPVQTTLEYLGQKIPVKLVNYSFTGMGLYVPSEYAQGDEVILAESDLVFPQHQFHGQLVYQNPTDSGIIQVGFALPVSFREGYLFKTDDPKWEDIEDETTVSNLYKDAVFKSYECPFYISQNNSVLSFFPIKMTGSGSIYGEIDQVKNGTVETGGAYCCFTLFQTFHLFKTEVVRITQDKIEIKLANKIQRILRRETLRVEKVDRPYELSVFLKNKYLNLTFHNDSVHDYSENGISILDKEKILSLPKDLYLDEVRISILGHGEIVGSGYVKSYFWNPKEQRFVLGIRFETSFEPNITNWHNFILKARYPQMDFKYINDDHKRIWSLFRQSGYLDFKKNERFDQVEKDSKLTWELLEKSGTTISKRIVMRKDDDIVGHLQLDKIYPKTWCPHHLAIGSGVKSTIAQDLLSIAPTILVKNNASYMLNFTDSSNQWFQKNYFSFVKSYKNPNANYLRHYKTYEVDLKVDSFNFDSNELDITRPNDFRLKEIQKFLKIHHSDIEYDALSFDDDPYLKIMNNELEKHGLYRRREYLSLFYKGDLIGLGILETGTEGINIIGILDVCYIIVDEEKHPEIAKQAEMSLIKQAIEYYADLNKQFVIFQLENALSDYTDNGLTFMCDTTRWVGMTEVSANFVCFTNYAYGHLFLKREMIRKKISEKRKKK